MRSFHACIAALAAVALSACSAADRPEIQEQPAQSEQEALTASTVPAPLAYYRFDDCKTTTSALRDSSGNALNGTWSGSIGCNASGKVKTAGSFNGTNSQVSVPDSATLDGKLSGAITVAAWVKPATLPSTSAHSYAIASKWNNTKDTFKLQLTSAGYKFTVAFPGSPEKQVAVQAAASLSSTSWTHVAGVYDPGASSVKLYVNGAVAASTSATGAPQATTAPFLIGNLPATSSNTYPFSGLIDELWLGGAALSQAQVQALMNGPHVDAAGACTETKKNVNVLMLVFDPFLPDQGQNLSSYIGAITPAQVTSDMISRLRSASGGLINYQITATRVLNEWPVQHADSPQLNESSYFNPASMTGGASYPGGNADYAALFNEQQICNLVQTQNLSEVWIWFPSTSNTAGSGFDELAYKIPGDNVPFYSQINNGWFYDLRKKNIPDCGKTVWVMGFNNILDAGYALHSYNHRIESIASIMIGQGRWFDTVDANDPWRLFSLYNFAYPGLAQVGTVHYPPNGGLNGANAPNGDYDYGNTGNVTSAAADWANYPFLTGATQSVNCNAWGCSQLGYETWYEQHIPHAAGTSYGGTCNDWWTYIADYDRRLATCSGSACLETNGGPCAASSDCASGLCVCNGAMAPSVCAPAGTAQNCAAKPNWEPCNLDSDCQSNWCGCNGGPQPKVCLPNQQYPKDCIN